MSLIDRLRITQQKREEKDRYYGKITNPPRPAELSEGPNLCGEISMPACEPSLCVVGDHKNNPMGFFTTLIESSQSQKHLDDALVVRWAKTIQDEVGEMARDFIKCRDSGEDYPASHIVIDAYGYSGVFPNVTVLAYVPYGTIGLAIHIDGKTPGITQASLRIKYLDKYLRAHPGHQLDVLNKLITIDKTSLSPTEDAYSIAAPIIDAGKMEQLALFHIGHGGEDGPTIAKMFLHEYIGDIIFSYSAPGGGSFNSKKKKPVSNNKPSYRTIGHKAGRY